MLFAQEFERVQRRASRPLHPLLILGFDEGAYCFEIIHLVGVEPVFETEQRFDGLARGGVVCAVVERSRDILLAKAEVALRER
jgi:hypothetical protein